MRRPAPLPDDGVPERDAGQGGEPAVSLELLYRNERHSLVRFFTRHRANPEDARDLTQEAFLRLARVEVTRGSALARPQAYLRQIAKNLLRDRAKAAFRRSEPLHASFDEETISAANEVERLEARDGLNRLEAAMARMKPKTREIFLAHRLDGMSYAEIAEVTGMSVSGVEKQMIRAIAQLTRLADGF